MPDIRLTVDGRPTVVEAGLTAGEVFDREGIASVVVRAGDQELLDLTWVPGDGDVIESVPMDSPEGLDVLRHSCAHVLAQAVQDIWPKARLGIGPPIVNGFYYDFDVETPFDPSDLERLETRMGEIVGEDQRFVRREVADDDARVELADEPYKLELIGLKGGAADAAEGAAVEVGAGQLTMYDNRRPDGSLAWKDLCRGPHLPSTAMIPREAFRLTRSAAAYWRGSEKNPQLQRIYGTAWPSAQELSAHLERLAEAERRDHRKLGTELDLFSFPDEIGSGLAVFHPKGGVVRLEMEDYSRRRHLAAGYDFVNSPHITKAQLFQTSGHLDWYSEGMFPAMAVDGGDYYLKPMNCPMHNLIYGARGRSYRELPIRLFEFGTVYRYEKSGVVHGLTRARGFTQDDAHIYCTREQMRGELTSLLTFVLDLLKDYGLDDFYLELSTKDPVKFVGTDEDWEVATDTLREVAEASGLELVPDPGGAAFYGPKISVQARDAIGRTWQMSTIQLDFNLPQRFDLEYQTAEGTRERPVMIHRALFGSIERFFAVLLEHYAGAFPAWLSPVQVVGIPIRAENVEYLHGVAERLRGEGVRVEVDDSDDRMQKKILRAQQQKAPFMLVAGPRDVEAGAVSMRYRNGTERRGVPLDDAIVEITRNILTRQVEPDALNPDELVP